MPGYGPRPRSDQHGVDRVTAGAERRIAWESHQPIEGSFLCVLELQPGWSSSG
jgi:hypothetical protein